jgi:hypothetical protein
VNRFRVILVGWKYDGQLFGVVEKTGSETWTFLPQNPQNGWKERDARGIQLAIPLADNLYRLEPYPYDPAGVGS